MRHSTKTTWLFAATSLAILATALLATEAQAAFSLKLSDGTSTVQVNDGSFFDFDGATGGIFWGGAIGKFDLTVSTGTSMPLVGSATSPLMHLSSSVRSRGDGGLLTITLTQTGFTGTPMGLDAAAFLSSIGGVAGGAVSMETWVGLSNGAYEQSVLLSDLENVGADGLFGGADSSSPTDLGSLFSLTMVVTVAHGYTPPGTRIVSSFDAELEALPEPSAASVWAGIGGFVSLGAFARRWRSGKPAV